MQGLLGHAIRSMEDSDAKSDVDCDRLAQGSRGFRGKEYL